MVFNFFDRDQDGSIGKEDLHVTIGHPEISLKYLKRLIGEITTEDMISRPLFLLMMKDELEL